MSPRTQPVISKRRPAFDVEAYLKAEGPPQTVAKYRRGQVIFTQGDAGQDVRYLQKGAIKLSVLSRIGKEAVVAMLVPGDFFGEGVLAGQSIRIGTATAIAPSSVVTIETETLVRLLHEQPAF